jgi:periplasmic divalent cation tolerance protein
MAEEVVIFITASSQEEAQMITDVLLDQKIAACINIVPSVKSCFWWEGKKETAEEVLLIVKSAQSLVDAVIRLVKEVHSYEVPEVVALPIISGNPDYLKWLREVVGTSS